MLRILTFKMKPSLELLSLSTMLILMKKRVITTVNFSAVDHLLQSSSEEVVAWTMDLPEKRSYGN